MLRASQTLFSTKTSLGILGSSNPVHLASKTQQPFLKMAICHSLTWIPGLALIKMYLCPKPAKKHPQSSCPKAATSPQPLLSPSKLFTASPPLQTVTAPCHRLAAMSGPSKKAPSPRVVEVYLRSMPPLFRSQTASATSVYPAALSPTEMDSAASRATRQSTPSMSP